ncbi:DUF3120 domain-containing protein [Leptothermofonsia sp. ETS-13]|uniref:DUF3120 domain-containing protein n=1 Tax=Leptothermofonsia sp. ETS-13 TaxID=3035696 RepID=UPI003BA00DBC
MVFFSSRSPEYASHAVVYSSEIHGQLTLKKRVSARHWLVLLASVFLVSVPVFLQAPLVRFWPWISLGLTPVLWWIGLQLSSRCHNLWSGDLLLGFTWTWLAGSIYWGWLRWEPLIHLPVESIGLPFAVWAIARNQTRIGSFFYLGSLFGTVVTDLYFYLVNLIPHWRQLMQVEGEQARPILQDAIAHMQTPLGVSWAIILALLLLGVSLLPLYSRQSCWWAFSGAVLSTILVDSLFWLAAVTA